MRRFVLTLSCSIAASLLAGCGGAGISHPPTAGALTLQSAMSSQKKGASEFNEHGNILIADQFNNRVIEIDPPSHRIVWQFGDGSNAPGPQSVVAPNDAERVGNLTLISGTGAPSGAEPGCGASAGCPDNRVMLVNSNGKIVWQYSAVNAPVCSTLLPNGHILITDQGNQRIIEVDRAKNVLWQYGATGVSGSGADQLNNPNSAELLENGHILIADEGNNRVIEIERSSKQIVWQYPDTPDTTLLNGAAFASRLPNGNTLISDSGNNRIIEVSSSKTVVWSYVTNTGAGSNVNPSPSRGIRLKNGNTLISDQFNHRVIEVDHHMPARTLFVQGQINLSGNGFDQLNAPYDAKVIKDFTGLTDPGDRDHDADDGTALSR